jgi:protein-disulfide isomerase
MRSRIAARTVAAFAALTIALPALAQSGSATADADIDPLSRAGEARAIGPDTAQVVVLEFIDFACPTCRAFHIQRGDSLRRAVGPNVRIVYVTFLFSDHPRSWHAAEAGICAGAVAGSAGYLAMADRLYRNADEWKNARDPGPLFGKYAREAGIDSVTFADCRARDAAAPLILSDLETARRIGVDGTPTFIIAPRGATSADQTSRTSGNVSITDLMALIDAARAKAK